jgi:DHA2 family multidrug resistance protein
VPLTTITFATLPAEKRGEATGLYNLSRNIGSAVGISMVSALLVQNTQINHEQIGSYITSTNRLLEQPRIAHLLDPFTLAGRAALDGMVTLQATIIAYVDDFKLMMILSLAALPLLLLLRGDKSSSPPQPDAAME